MAGILDWLLGAQQPQQAFAPPNPPQATPATEMNTGGGMLHRMGNALLGFADPYGMNDPNAMSPEQRQQGIGMALLNMGMGIANSQSRNPLVAAGEGIQYANRQGQQQGESAMRGALFRQQIEDRRKKAEAQKKIGEVLSDPSRRGELPSVLAEYDPGAAASAALRSDERKDDREYRERKDAEDRAFRLQLQGLSFGQQRALIELRNKLENDGGGRFSNQPVYVTDPEGNVRIIQLNQQGKAKLTELPEGMSVASNLNKIDVGTGTALVDPRTGSTVRTISKDIAGTEAQKKIGEAQGQNVVQAPGAIAKGEQTLQLIEKIRSHPGLSGAVGWEANLPDMITAPAGSQTRDFITLLEQAQGQQFLQAFETLKGGGQITQVEGEKATQAIARMQRAQSEASFRQALKDYEDVVKAGMERLRRGVVVAPPGGSDGAGSPKAPPANIDDLLNKYAPR